MIVIECKTNDLVLLPEGKVKILEEGLDNFCNDFDMQDQNQLISNIN